MADEKANKPKKEIQPPTWLDAAFIQDALRRGGEKNLQVTRVTARPATAPGDNYVSSIFRMKITLAGGDERSLLVKVAPPGNDMATFIDESGVFRIEAAMFTRLLPEMQALLNTAAPGRYPPLAARCFHHGNDPVFLVLQDLSEQGFKMADRHRGLGIRHCLVALRTLARFHAASAAVLERNPSVAKGFANPFRDNNRGFELFTLAGVQGAADACRKWPGFEEYARCLDNFKPLIMEKFMELNDPKPETFNVMLHGDFWMNNMLFRYEDGIPHELRVVDLQISHIAPAALDVVYFLGTSLSEEVSIHHRDLLLREYHSALVETMDLLGLQPPSLERILADVDSHGAYSLFGTLDVLPFVKAQKTPDIDALMGGADNTTGYLYDDPVVKRWLQRLIPEYRRKGWLPG